MKPRTLTCGDIEEWTEESFPTTPAIDETDASTDEQDLTIEVVRGR